MLFVPGWTSVLPGGSPGTIWCFSWVFYIPLYPFLLDVFSDLPPHFTSKLQLLLRGLWLPYSSVRHFSWQNTGFGPKSHILSEALCHTSMSCGMKFPSLMAQGQWPSHNFPHPVGLVPRACVLPPMSCGCKSSSMSWCDEDGSYHISIQTCSCPHGVLRRMWWSSLWVSHMSFLASHIKDLTNSTANLKSGAWSLTLTWFPKLYEK